MVFLLSTNCANHNPMEFVIKLQKVDLNLAFDRLQLQSHVFVKLDSNPVTTVRENVEVVITYFTLKKHTCSI